MIRLKSVLLLLCCACLVGTVGCEYIGLGGEDPSPKKVRRKPPPPKEPVDVDDEPSEPRRPERSIELRVDGSRLAVLPNCYVKSTPATPQTPMTLLVSSDADENISYPSFFMRVVLTGDDVKSSTGQRLKARIWFALQPNDDVFHLEDGAPAEVTIRKVESDGKVTGAILQANFANTHADETKEITGEFTGVLEAMAAP